MLEHLVLWVIEEKRMLLIWSDYWWNFGFLAAKLFKVFNNFGPTSNTLKTKGGLRCRNERRSAHDKQTNVSFVTDEESLKRPMEMQSSKEAKLKFTAYWMIGLSKPIRRQNKHYLIERLFISSQLNELSTVTPSVCYCVCNTMALMLNQIGIIT